MSSITAYLPKPARKVLGRWKCNLLDRWPYLPAMRRIPQHRQRLQSSLDALAPIPFHGDLKYEIHMLCGQRDLDMGIWASWSIMRFLDGKAGLIVHSDGSLNDDDAGRWRRVVPDMEVIHRQDGDAVTAGRLKSSTKHLLPWRDSHWASAQLIDVHCFGTARSILVMDSDVLCFSKPTEVIEALEAAEPRFGWSEDLLDAYSGDLEVLKEITGVAPVRKLCAGFLVTPRLSAADFQRLDDLMERIGRDGRIDLDHCWSCQTYYAILAAAHPNARSFSERYANIVGRAGASQVLRHYVGVPKVRFRYFTEGLPRILADMRLA